MFFYNSSHQGGSCSTITTEKHEHKSTHKIAISEEASRPCPQSSRYEWLRQIMDDRNNQSSKPQIQRVSPVLQMNGWRYYNPIVVSLGPYHHGKPELELVERFKPIIAREFVLESGKPVDAFYNKILQVAGDARNSYVGGSTNQLSDEAFAQMLFLDSCFILQMIDCIVHNKLETKHMIINHLGFLVSTLMIPDLFLLENQIPFFVLQALMSLKFQGDEGAKMIETFIDDIFLASSFPQARDPQCLQPLHLLEFLRSKLLHECGKDHQKLQSYKLHQLKSKKKTQGTAMDHPHLFCSVTELKAKGIHFKPSNTRCLKNIKFKSNCVYGQLMLPPKVIGPQTKQVFLNLIAYEMGPNTPNDMGVASYIYFMNSLINRPDDVAELRSQGILLNFLGSDEEVLEMFKEIAAFSMHNLDTYKEVKECIQKHCNSKMKTWIAEVVDKHFSNPWTVVALFAAIFIIALSIIQTYFTVFPIPNRHI
ncbi:putative UPF0481 protein At3g02645 [Malania oleifera]|uniref:putative UPF0481 protein At3g02645 n=1 Tax=Malania oleifera TaxID=397392 RepID=UPI0025AE4EC0|nr:putative UPF0481 protein At3g02645 [Malania oleifera]